MTKLNEMVIEMFSRSIDNFKKAFLNDEMEAKNAIRSYVLNVEQYKINLINS